tara:strand:+ start:658 stop:870 length:213 start_codon:yes stop_codon:yes gene_type:complete
MTMTMTNSHRYSSSLHIGHRKLLYPSTQHPASTQQTQALEEIDLKTLEEKVEKEARSMKKRWILMKEDSI